MANVTLSGAIQAKDFNILSEVVKQATATYNAGLGKEPKVNTAFGEVPVSAVFDDDTKWVLVATAYAGIVNAVGNLPAGADKVVEIAKLIATNQTLRYIVEGPKSGNGLL